MKERYVDSMSESKALTKLVCTMLTGMSIYNLTRAKVLTPGGKCFVIAGLCSQSFADEFHRRYKMSEEELLKSGPC